MASLYKLFAQLPENDWNYYSSFEDNMPIQKPIVENNSSKQFIYEYFVKAGKEYLMEEFDLNKLSIKRADHTVSIFFFGLILFHYTSFKSEIFTEEIKPKLYDAFQFIWFITCLSHDLAFDREHETELLKQCPDLEHLKEHFKIRYDLTKEVIDNVPADLLDCCKDYFKFRHQNQSCDHGIHAGVFMYDRLVKNRKIKHKQNNDHLLWQPWLDPLYAYAAATVVVHNMWLPMKEDFDKYREFSLSALVSRAEKKRKITFKDAPLLFLLGLVDTIDPVKAYRDLNPIYVLKNIYFTVQSKNRFTLTVSKRLPLENMERQIDSLGLWLAIETNISGRIIRFYLP